MKMIILPAEQGYFFSRSLEIIGQLTEMGYTRGTDFECYANSGWNEVHVRFLTAEVAAVETYLRLTYI
jgi:hypothetical protein